MRLEDGTGRALSEVLITLTLGEASEMADTLRQMVEDPAKHSHEHVSDQSWLESGHPEDAREITLSIAKD